MNPSEVKQAGIIIIESLKPTETQTGSQLADGILKYKKFQTAYSAKTDPLIPI